MGLLKKELWGWVALGLYGLFQLGCIHSNRAQSAKPVAQADWSVDGDTSVLGHLDGRAITVADLDADFERALSQKRNEYLQQRLELQWYGFQSVVDDALLAEAAAARGLSVDAYLQRELAQRTKPVREEEVNAFYQEHRTRIQAPLESVSAFIKDQMRNERKKEAKAGLAQSLRDGRNIAARLSLEGLPRNSVDTQGPAKGANRSKVTIVEYSDFECPYCSSVKRRLDALVQRHPDSVRVVYKHFPLGQHPNAQSAAIASMCAQNQNKFWPFHDALFSAESLGETLYVDTATSLGLDLDAFNRCRVDPNTTQALLQEVADARTLGVSGTPSFFLNGVKLVHLYPDEVLDALISAELEQKDGP